MAAFTYLARDVESGRELRGSTDAPSEEEAVKLLLGRNLLVVSISEKVGRKGKTAGGSVSQADLAVFTRLLATMIDAGLAMVECLQALADQTSSKIMRDVIRDLCTRVEAGDSFSAALSKHPKVFTRLYSSMVQAGESGGLLAEVLARLATYIENTARLRKKVKSAMMYPIGVSVFCGLITVLLLQYVVPEFANIYKDLGAKLPAPTQFLVSASEWFKTSLPYLIPASVLAVYGWIAWLKTPTGRDFWDRTRIRLPVFGVIAHKIVLARFTRTLSSLVRSGVPLLEVLSIVANTAGNTVVERAVRAAAGDIERGESISSALGKHPVFPAMVIRMLTAGEQTGKIDAMLERVANFLDEEVETMISGLSSLMEPILMAVLGVIIGGIVICMYLPILNMVQVLNK